MIFLTLEEVWERYNITHTRVSACFKIVWHQRHCVDTMHCKCFWYISSLWDSPCDYWFQAHIFSILLLIRRHKLWWHVWVAHSVKHGRWPSVQKMVEHQLFIHLDKIAGPWYSKLQTKHEDHGTLKITCNTKNIMLSSTLNPHNMKWEMSYCTSL